MAVSNGDLEFAKLLLEHKIDPNIRSYNTGAFDTLGRSPLSIILENVSDRRKHEPLVELLVEAGAHVDIFTSASSGTNDR